MRVIITIVEIANMAIQKYSKALTQFYFFYYRMQRIGEIIDPLEN